MCSLVYFVTIAPSSIILIRKRRVIVRCDIVIAYVHIKYGRHGGSGARQSGSIVQLFVFPVGVVVELRQKLSPLSLASTVQPYARQYARYYDEND